jgi:hypothetical protein
MTSKRLVVCLSTSDADRVAEALRGAVGLSLRGDSVSVVLLAAVDLGEERARRAVATLRGLGHWIDAPVGALRDADAVEVWT